MAEKTRSVLRDLGGSQIGAWVRDLNRKDCGLTGTQLHVVVVRRDLGGVLALGVRALDHPLHLRDMRPAGSRP